MQINLYFEYASIIISVLLLVYFGTTRKVSNFHNKVFLTLIIANTLTAFFDVTNKLLDFYGGKLDYLRLTTMGYFVTHLMILPLIFFYVLTTVKNWYELDTRFKVVVTLPIALAFAILLSNPFTSIVYHYDADGTYNKGDGYIMLYILVAFYMLLMIYVLFYYKEYFSVVKRVLLCGEIAIIIVALFIQSVDYSLRVETFGITYCLLFMFFFLQNPNDQLDIETGLYNRNSFYDVMSLNIAAKRYFNLVEIIVTDFDDVYVGENENGGETIPSQIAEFLRNLDPTNGDNENDLEGKIDVYRIQNNLFCLQITDMPEEEIIKLIKIIRKRFKQPWNQNNYEVFYKVKMCHISVPEDIDSLAKLVGIIKGSVAIDDNKELLSVSDFDLGRLERQTGLNAAISKALNEERIEIVFSPVCSVNSRRIVSADTNMRIFDKEIGYINEEEIIDFAERNGKIATLYIQQLNKLCKFITDNNPKSLGLEFIGVELSAAMCHQVGFIEYLISKIKEYNIDPSLVCFRVSEYTVHKAPDTIKEITAQLREEGFKFCLDDYGSGFTNLASIYELSFDIIKISNSVMKEAASNTKARITLESTFDLAKDLGMHTVVGGIDSEEYFEIITKAGCQYALGEYFLVNISEKELINILVAQENAMAFTNVSTSFDNLTNSNSDSNQSEDNKNENKNGGIA